MLFTMLVGAVSSQNYSALVKDLFKDLQAQYPSSNGCVTQATKKMNMFPNKLEDEKYAVALINIYSQSCPLNPGTFYGVLNEQLRSGQPGPFWERTEDILNQGILLLGESTFRALYRGCTNTAPFTQGLTYRFNQFISTSLQENVARGFAGTGTNSVLFYIKDAKGLGIHNYSAFPGEKEVLLKSSSTFTVQSVTTHTGLKVVELQFTERFRRADTSVIEASYCEFDKPSSGAAEHTKMSVILFAFSIIPLVSRA